MSRLIDADRLLSDKMKQKYYHLPNGDTAIPIIDIEHAPTVGGWISVKDRLPENEQYVMLWTKTGVMKYAKYLNDEPHRPWITYDEDGSIRAWDNVVTHWMPLPEPPKEEKDDDTTSV